MSSEPFFMCVCGSTILAVSHSWTNHRKMEEIGHVAEDGRYRMGDRMTIEEDDLNHQWVAYCGGCGHGVTVEWLDGNKLRLFES